MTLPTNPTQGLALNESTGREILQATINDYVALLQRQPAICGTPQQQEELMNHVAQGHQLIKLVNSERLKITRQLDEQKQDWMELEKELTTPIHQAMQPLKEAVEHYNREMLRIRQHQQTVATEQASTGSYPEWLTPEVALLALPKGIQMKWTFKIVDPNQVPNGYWIIDQAALKAAIASGVREIPGIRIYEEAITSFRAHKSGQPPKVKPVGDD